MQSVSSRIWIRVAMSISHDENHYTPGITSQNTSFNLALTTRGWFFLICKEARFGLDILATPLFPAKTTLSRFEYRPLLHNHI